MTKSERVRQIDILVSQLTDSRFTMAPAGLLDQTKADIEQWEKILTCVAERVGLDVREREWDFARNDYGGEADYSGM